MAKTIFQTDKKESFSTQYFRIGFNWFPAYRRTGGRACFISEDWKEIHVKLGLNWKTKNYVGTVFGGSIYGALDPIYMIQLIKILGDKFVVWDKAACIKFIKPIKKTVYARFLIPNELLKEIDSQIQENKKYSFDLIVKFEDEEGSTYAEATKTMYVADKEYYKNRKK